MNDVWQEQVARVEDRRLKAYQRHVARIDKARERLAEELSEVESELEQLEARRDDLTVLERRTVGIEKTVYHVDPEGDYDGRACGHVTGQGRDPSHYDRKLEGQASARLRRCSFCTWPSPALKVRRRRLSGANS